MLERDAIVIGDGGDYVSYAGRVIDSYEPGCWLDPGPFGCLGTGPGYALAAKLARPERQVVLLVGDGAFGFSGMEFDTLARHGVNVVAVMGNNGIWALEKHPMELLYGYSVAADLRPETRYEQGVEALGGHGELVRAPRGARPALERAFAAGKPALVNVLTDPAVAYPRKVEPRLRASLSRGPRGGALHRRGCRARRPRPPRARMRAAASSSRIMPATIVGARSGFRPTTARRRGSVISARRASSSSTVASISG